MLNLKVYFLHPEGNTRDDLKSMIKENISSIAAANCVHVDCRPQRVPGRGTCDFKKDGYFKKCNAGK